MNLANKKRTALDVLRRFGECLIRPFRGSAPGASLVEYMIVTGFVALFAIGAFNRYGQIIHEGLKVEAKRIEGQGLPSTLDLLSSLGDSEPPLCDIFNRRFCVPGSGNCFAKGTPVATEAGDRPIEQVRVGDLVWARDVATGRMELRPVIRTFVTPGKPVIELELRAGGKLENVTVTPGHRFWVSGQGWTPAEDLAAKPLYSFDSALSATPLPSRGEIVTVYNLEVEGLNNYFVGHSHALVHNQNSNPNPNNCPPGGNGNGNGTGGAGNGAGNGTGGTGPAATADPLVPCYKGDASTISQGDLPANARQRIQDLADQRKTASSSVKGQLSEQAGDAAATGYTDDNFPAPDWSCQSASGSRVFDRTCVNSSTGAAVVLEAKGGTGRLTTRQNATKTGTVRQGTPEYLDAVIADLMVSNPVLARQLAAAKRNGDMQYVLVTQKFDAAGNPVDVQVREFELDQNQRATNCQK